MFSIGSLVRSFVCYRPCEHDRPSLQTNEPILLQLLIYLLPYVFDAI